MTPGIVFVGAQPIEISAFGQNLDAQILGIEWQKQVEIGRLAMRWAGPRDTRRQIESETPGVSFGPSSGLSSGNLAATYWRLDPD